MKQDNISKDCTAEYVYDLAVELAKLCVHPELNMLKYLLTVAAEEAKEQQQKRIIIEKPN